MTETHTYTAQLDQAIERLHAEGRYRAFIDIVREKGNFPHAVWQREDDRTQPVSPPIPAFILLFSIDLSAAARGIDTILDTIHGSNTPHS